MAMNRQVHTGAHKRSSVLGGIRTREQSAGHGEMQTDLGRLAIGHNPPGVRATDGSWKAWTDDQWIAYARRFDG